MSLSGLDIEQCKPVDVISLNINQDLVHIQEEQVIVKEQPVRSGSLLNTKDEPTTSGTFTDTKKKQTTHEPTTSGSLIDVSVDKQSRRASLVDMKEVKPIKYTGMHVTGLLDDVWNPMTHPESDANHK